MGENKGHITFNEGLRSAVAGVGDVKSSSLDSAGHRSSQDLYAASSFRDLDAAWPSASSSHALLELDVKEKTAAQQASSKDFRVISRRVLRLAGRCVLRTGSGTRQSFELCGV